MRISLLLLFLSICSLSATSYSQEALVTMDIQNGTMEDVLTAIKSQTPYSFWFDSGIIDVNEKVSISAEDQPVKEVLETLLDTEKVNFRMNGHHIIISKAQQEKDLMPSLIVQQDRRLTGTVTDEMGYPVIGANVVVKNTSNGTISDMDGNFTIQVTSGATLQVSYIGYITQEVKVGEETLLEVILKEDARVMEEVVVVGYGIQKKSNVTGSISSIKMDDVENRSITDASQALQGKISGIQLVSTSAAPGSAGNIRIRGFSSNATSDPLYVVDGVRANSIDNLNPGDIESMEVLKDGASAAIYGAEAGNGVILVTTRQGKKGAGQITYDFQYSIQQLQRKPRVMNAEQYLDFMLQAGNLTQSKVDEWDGTDTVWADELFETSGMQKHTISLQGGNEKGSYYTSLNYLDMDGIVKGNNDTFKRFTATLNADYKIKDWIKVSWNNTVAYTKRNVILENDANNSVVRTAMALDPCTPVTTSPDNLSPLMQGLVDAGRKLVKDKNGNYYTLSSFSEGGDDINPFILMDSRHDKRWGYVVQGNLAFDLTPVKNLTITSRLGYRANSSNQNQYQAQYYATAVKQATEESIEATVRSGLYYQWENFANYLFNFGKHSLVTMLGTSISQEIDNYVSTGGTGLTVDNPLFAYPDYLASGATSLIHDGDQIDTRKLSFFGRLSYDYDNRYMAQVTLRADAADLSILPKTQRWGYFPAISVGWSIFNEEWFPKNTIISSAKIRASWGQNGSIAGLSNFAYMNAILSGDGYSFTPGESSYINSSYPSSTGNDKLKWETSEQFDIGFDLAFLNNRLTLNIDYYKKKTKDLIVAGTKPTLTVGNTVSPVNAGNVENSGFEFELGWRDKVKDFSYSINANLATLNNKVTYLDSSIDRIEGGSYNSRPLTYFEKGYPVWYLRGYKVDHINPQTGDPVYLAADGSLTETPTADDQMKIGSAIPDFTYGLTINLAYKNFDLALFGQGSYGNDIYCALTKADRPTTNRLACFYTDAWSPTNTNAKYARPDYAESNYLYSSINVFNGSYFKIKQIQVGYTLPEKINKKMKISKARIYASLDDFFTFTKYPGMDPEISAGPTTMIGVDLGSFPNPRKVVLGFNLSF